MRRVKLLFPNAADVWNFLVLSGQSGVKAENSTLEGFFSQGDIELACRVFKATVREQNIIDVPLPAGNGNYGSFGL
jgi:hypothetical protein